MKTVFVLAGLVACLALTTASSYGYRHGGSHHRGGHGGGSSYRYKHDVTCYDRNRRGVKYQYQGDISDGCSAARRYCGGYNSGGRCMYDRCSVGGGSYCGQNLCHFDNHDDRYDGGNRREDNYYSHDVTCYDRNRRGVNYKYRGDIRDGCSAARRYCNNYNSGGGCMYDRCSVGGGSYCGQNLCNFDNDRYSHDVTCYDRNRRGVNYKYRGDIRDGCSAARKYCGGYNSGGCMYNRCSVGGGSYCGQNLCYFDNDRFDDRHNDRRDDRYNDRRDDRRRNRRQRRRDFRRRNRDHSRRDYDNDRYRGGDYYGGSSRGGY